MRSFQSLLCAAVLAVASLAGAAETKSAKPGKTEITWWGHAAFVVKTPGGATLAIDPWLTNPKAPKDMAWPEQVDAILVSHGHFDHVGDTVALAKKTGATVVASYELSSLLGVAKSNGMNPGGSMRVKDATIFVVPAVHSTGYVANPQAQNAKPEYGGTPVGFIIQIDHGPTLYHAGDTDVFPGMGYIAERFKPTVAMLPIGGQFTMDPVGAAYAAKLLKAKTIVPMHFGTFPALAGTPAELATALKAQHVSAKVETLEIGKPTQF